MPKRGENIRKRKDGRWEGRYIKSYDFDGKAKYGSVYGKSYFEVKRKLLQTIEEYKTGALPDSSRNISLREVLFLWLQNNKIKLRPQTYGKYLYLIENHLVPEIGSYKINKVEASAINLFLEKKVTSGRLDGEGGLASSYIKSIIFILKAALRFAVSEGYRPQLLGEIHKPPTRKSMPEVLSVQEQSILEEYLLSDIDSSKFGIYLALHTGLRLGEICGLRWQDIDLKNKTLQIRHTVERIQNVGQHKESKAKTRLVLGEPKTDTSGRVIPLPSYLFQPLIMLRNRTGGEFLVEGTTYPYLDPRTYQYRFHRYLQECGLRRVNFHALRHTFATRCMEVGVDVKSLSEMLGHSGVNITLNTYVHSSIEQKRVGIEKLSAIRGQNYGQLCAAIP